MGSDILVVSSYKEGISNLSPEFILDECLDGDDAQCEESRNNKPIYGYMLPNLSPSPNLYKVQSVYNNNVHVAS